ncbi:GDNF family receptor alpha-like protein [Myotis davidii]|uniref:GDNF family receptor alpha-like protein n=1 Tax=Myotis davidii TaxID=225400 RepID=L5M8Q7_MYODS|nr:GDNF family receptor alpha-like protein [Myotis davidii]
MQELPPGGQCTPTAGALLSWKPGSWLASAAIVVGPSPFSAAALRSGKPSGTKGIRSCLEVAEMCVGDAVCNAQLALYLKACSANGNLCDVKHCQAAIRFFYQNMPFNIAQMLAFCDCAPSDIPCQQSKEALHSKPCAVNIVPPPTCLNVIRSCRNDELCRRRYRTFQSKCWQPVTRKCHEDETCISTLGKQDLICSGSDDCKAAYMGTLGTVLQVQCTCRTVSQSEESLCKMFQHMLHRRSCFRGDQRAIGHHHEWPPSAGGDLWANQGTAPADYSALSNVKGIAWQKRKQPKEKTLHGSHSPSNGEVIYAVMCMTVTCGILLVVLFKLRFGVTPVGYPCGVASSPVDNMVWHR